MDIARALKISVVKMEVPWPKHRLRKDTCRYHLWRRILVLSVLLQRFTSRHFIVRRVYERGTEIINNLRKRWQWQESWCITEQCERFLANKIRIPRIEQSHRMGGRRHVYQKINSIQKRPRRCCRNKSNYHELVIDFGCISVCEGNCKTLITREIGTQKQGYYQSSVCL